MHGAAITLTMEFINVGIIGGGGYAAGELIRLLLNHPNVQISFVNSASQSGKLISDLHPDLEDECHLKFTDSWNPDADVLFLCRGHGLSKTFLEGNNVPPSTRIIDLSSDFRLAKNANGFGRSFIYGLPEVNRQQISKSQSIANPGCFATGIILALLPIAKGICDDIHINCITGSTGAGQSLAATSLFSWRNNNVSAYKVFQHQHLDEIQETLFDKPHVIPRLYMVPVRGNFPRGIFSTIYTRTDLSEQEVRALYEKQYQNHPFVSITNSDLYLKKVLNTNKVFISVKKNLDMIYIESIIDNLMKGASGQAIQNMNLMFGLEETTGLKTKASVY